MKNILFLGERVIARKCFAALTEPLYKKSFSVKAVVSNKAFHEDCVHEIPAESGPVFIFNSRRNEVEILEAIKAFKIDTLISVQHPWILPGEILKAVNGRAFNLHNAKLPDYKGYNTISHAILNGDDEYTTTITWMVEAVDSGPVAYEIVVSIDADDTAWSLYEKSVHASVENFRRLLQDLYHNNPIPCVEAEGDGHFYRKKDIEPLKIIHSLEDFEELDRKARAFYFPYYEPAYFIRKGVKFYVSRVPYDGDNKKINRNDPNIEKGE